MFTYTCVMCLVVIFIVKQNADTVSANGWSSIGGNLLVDPTE